jgi:KaiC/GvpD/RAD55 family RecA-like ATPase
MNERTISDFLGKMGLEKNIWYKNMDDVYVAPIEFSEINSLLSREKIVILTGTKEYGKTFTAIKLLWEYYKNGYEPRYVQTQYENKAEVRHKLVRIENTLEKRHIIYFEDPFGKLDYQSDEDLERDIGALVDTVRGLHKNRV